MANKSRKRIAAENDRALTLYLRLMVAANALHLAARCWWFAGPTTNILARCSAVAVVDAIMGACLFWIRGNSASGVELSAGLGSYALDVIYISLFVLVATGLLSDWFWYTYLAIPAYVTYRLATSSIVRGLLGMARSRPPPQSQPMRQ